jgi:hypothetical protein
MDQRLAGDFPGGSRGFSTDLRPKVCSGPLSPPPDAFRHQGPNAAHHSFTLFDADAAAPKQAAVCRILPPVRCRPRFAAPNSAAGRPGQIVSKSPTNSVFSTIRGRFSEAEMRFFLPSGRRYGSHHGPTPPRTVGVRPAPRRRRGAFSARGLPAAPMTWARSPSPADRFCVG